MKDLKVSKTKPLFEHPNKWKDIQNCKYYDDYIGWQQTVNDGQYMNMCFHDEVRVEKNSIKIY